MTSLAIDCWAEPKTRERFQELVGDPLLDAVFAESQRLSVPVYLVGGVVRDLLLGRPLHDVDLTVPAARPDFERLLASLQQRVSVTAVVLDVDRGVVRLVPRRSAGEYPGAVVDHLDFALGQGEDLIDDLGRRDLTLNALALDRQGLLHDPYGGFEDLRAGKLREVGPTAFLDDPLRCLRALRFSALLKLGLASSTLERMQRAAPGLDGVAGERIAEELFAFLGALHYPEPTAASGLWEGALFGKGGKGGEGGASEPLAWGDYQRWCGSSEPDALRSEPPVRQGRALVSLVGLGVLLGAGRLAEPKRAEPVLERLKLSRREAGYLTAWAGAYRGLGELAQERASLTVDALWQLKRDSKDALPGAWSAALALCPALRAQEEGSKRFSRLQAVVAGWGELQSAPLPFEVSSFVERSGRRPGPWVKELLLQLESDWRCGRAVERADLAERAERYLLELSP